MPACSSSCLSSALSWDLLTAGAVLITVPAAIVFFFAQKHLVAGLTAGGTKG